MGLHTFRSGIDFRKQLHVTFVGEPAVDAGGPLHYYCLLAVANIPILYSGRAITRTVSQNVSATPAVKTQRAEAVLC